MNNKRQKNDKTHNAKKFNQYRKWSFGTLNIRTGIENDDGAKMYSVAKEMSKTDLPPSLRSHMERCRKQINRTW